MIARAVRHAIATAALASATLPADAHADDAQLWLGAGASGPIAGKLRGSIDSVIRFGDQAGSPYEAVIQGALGYDAAKRVTLWIAYVHKAIYADTSTAIERRVREDIALADIVRFGPIHLSARLRLEQRWRDDKPGIGWRMRPQVSASLPLTRGGLALVASEEAFVNFDDRAGQTAGYDRLRSAIALSLSLSRRVHLDTGYLRQFTRRAARVDALTATLGWRW